ncbi:protein BPS1, chloroplastic-like [Cynara cardunculus var. scolymus]|uniref:BYPASS-related protein n=1 Tax=Cynara cardunculus var. scolymus TaxID=59895 RepID=A0A118JYC1_CYNCS|nr:protein BPS1, chloroplastic-like [Cynara cardunculus var. scolymus]XP_024988621.1 protein BPS1, chloroplastic-like [Cynara cardunculus var. scolymus]XP_024988622.1 protein BPS1, chloroplastic-like [Cynara cardunculus var. scolymus]KVH97269.1 BYPASS-related protein [Cynara cardunculus var. scolymus]
MSRSEGPHRPFLPIGNPFKMMMPKSSHLPSRVLSVFEKNLAERFRQLKPNHANDVISFAWMKLASSSICETLDDIRKLIVDLELPICSWDIKWVDMYLDNSLKLLDFCSAYGTDIVRQRFGYVMLKCALLDLDSDNPQKFLQASSSLHEWRQYQSRYDNSKLEDCSDIICKLEETLNLPKIKNIPKAKDLVRAMYGLKVQTIFIFSTFVAAFSASPRSLFDLQVHKQYLWQESFTDLQDVMNGEIKNIHACGRIFPLKELRTIDQNVKKLYPLLHDGLGDIKQEDFESYCLELKENNEKFLVGLDELKSEMDRFFKVVVDGRMALLDNFQQEAPRSGVQQVRM